MTLSALKKIKLTVEHKLYGPTVYDAFERDGLCVHKSSNGKYWQIRHVESGSFIAGRNEAKTKAEAVSRMERLLELPVKWTLPFDEMRHSITARRAEIMEIVTR